MSTNWSEQQKSIFNEFVNPDGNVLVRARAGTGKTTTILEAINHAPENKILLAAFNKSIATEMAMRLKNPKAEASTLHSIGFRELRKNWQGIKVDDKRAEQLARRAAGVTAPDNVVFLIKKLAAFGKNMVPINPTLDDMIDIAEAFDLLQDEEVTTQWDTERICSLAIEAMKLALEKDGMIDFDDMIYVPIVNNWVAPTYDMVVIDECQDMNAAQIILCKKICKKGGRIIVVGDDRQAIYGFRGADSGSLDRLKVELNAKEFPLTITYRCPKSVVELARTLVPDLQASPTAAEGFILTKSPEEMYKLTLVGDFVLSRKNAPLAGVALRLLREGKRTIIKGRDIGAGLIAITKRIKARSVPDFLAKLTAYEERHAKRLSASKKNADAKIGLLNDQCETLRSLAEGLVNVDEIRARIESLFADVDSKTGKNAIVCSSVHKIKGMEATNVWLLEDTLRAGNGGEEANIAYVAYTRAKMSLYMINGLG
jgi:superfamily I DNA/RNA helicase